MNFGIGRLWSIGALVVPKQLKIGCCCYQQLTTLCHDPGNLGMALYCAPQRALFPDRPRGLDWQVLTADRGHSQERASVVTLVGLPKGGIAIRIAEDDNVAVSGPPTFRKSANWWSTRAAAERRSAWTREGAGVPTRPSPARRCIACFSTKLIEGASKEAQNVALRRRIGRTVLILICSLFVSGCVNHGKKLHKRADRDVPRSNGSPVVQVACAVPLGSHSDDSCTGSC